MSAYRPHRRDHVHEHADHDQHGRAHVHAPASFGTAFAVGIGLNLTFVAVEFSYGVLANSVALMADAGHNLSDVVGLVIAWIASALSKRAPSSRYTYGLGRSSILAAVFNAVLLLVAVGAIAWEAVLRLFHPEPVASGTVMIVAAIGIIVAIGCLTRYSFGIISGKDTLVTLLIVSILCWAGIDIQALLRMRFRPSDPVRRNRTVHAVKTPAFLYFHRVLVCAPCYLQHRRPTARVGGKNNTLHVVYPAAMSGHQEMLVETSQYLLHESIKPAPLNKTARFRFIAQGRRDKDYISSTGGDFFA